MLSVQILAVGIDVPQKLDLVNRLVKVVFVVLDDLHAHHLLSVDVVALDSLAECSRAQVLHHLVPSGYNRVDHDWEVFRLLEAGLLSVKHHSQAITVINDLVKFCRVELVIRGHEFDMLR